MQTIDLHMHSVYSDGTYTPTELVTYAKKKGLLAISLTDHDTIEGLYEARQQAELAGLHFINGVEINSFCYLNNRRVNIHVLGYSFAENAIRPYMATLKTLRDEHNAAILKALRELGVELFYEDLGTQSEKNIITRLNFAKALTRKGYTKNVGEALDKYLHKGGAAYVEYNNHDFAVVVRVIHDAGGIAALAHPAEYGLSDEETESLVAALKNEGLDAVECIHPSQSAVYSRKMMDLAKQNGLRMTGGSDFHGKSDDGADLGTGGEGMSIPESFLRDLV